MEEQRRFRQAYGGGQADKQVGAGWGGGSALEQAWPTAYRPSWLTRHSLHHIVLPAISAIRPPIVGGTQPGPLHPHTHTQGSAARPGSGDSQTKLGYCPPDKYKTLLCWNFERRGYCM